MCRALRAIVLVLLPLATALQAQAGRPGKESSPRLELPLNNGWRFELGGESAPADGDAAWKTVTVPHTWNRVGYYKDTPSAHINTAQNVVITQGVGWYKLTFLAPASAAGKESLLQFDAASRIATVWLNGKELGTHRGGFSRFRLDATASLKPGEKNELTVKVDNTKPALGSSTADVLPLTGDFFVYGGLYRPVSLVVANKTHLDLMDYGSSGVSARTVSITPDGAHVQVRALVRNDGGENDAVVLRARLAGAGGAVAASGEQSVDITAAHGAERTIELTVPHPHLWQGVSDPFLYQLNVEVVRKGKVVDRVTLPFGIREVRFDANEGLFLNGKHVAVHGVGYHQDREGKGWASNPEDVAADVATMREMGVTGVRPPHYQHGQPIHDEADHNGLVVWDEIPLVSQWTLGENLQPTAGLRANAQQQLHEMIAQDYNHPSVVTWSIGNEIDFGNSIPAFVGNKSGALPDPIPLLRELNKLAHELDPSRPTTLATCCEARYGPKEGIPVTGAVTDMSGANRYFGWYYDRPEDLGPHLDVLHRTRPQQPIAVTEYGAGGAVSLHSDNALGGPESRNRPQAEEYESYIHEQNWSVLKTKPYLWATFLWNSFDFGSTTRSEGNAQDINTKGIVTFDHRHRKDAYFFYKANWTASPTVHINSALYVERAYRVTDVRVYSNAKKTVLTVNGKPLGALSACADNICVWKNVVLNAGENSLIARGLFAGGNTTDAVKWHLTDAAAQITLIDCGALVGTESAGKHFGSDTFFEGGSAREIAGKSLGYGRAPVPPQIAGAESVAVAATYRVGSFVYRVPAANGKHEVLLAFVEPSLPEGQRTFDVIANGEKVLANFDVAAGANGTSTEHRRTISVNVTDGFVVLEFKPVKGEAVVSAIEVR